MDSRPSVLQHLALVVFIVGFFIFLLPLSNAYEKLVIEKKFANTTKQNSINNVVATVKYGEDVKATGLAFVEYFYDYINYGDSPDTDMIAGVCLFKPDSKLYGKKSQQLKRIHLIFTQQSQLKCSDLVGHRVEVVGTLGEVITGHHHGDALLDVKAYKILR